MNRRRDTSLVAVVVVVGPPLAVAPPLQVVTPLGVVPVALAAGREVLALLLALERQAVEQSAAWWLVAPWQQVVVGEPAVVRVQAAWVAVALERAAVAVAVAVLRRVRLVAVIPRSAEYRSSSRKSLAASWRTT